MKFLATNCQPPFPEKEVKAKVESALERSIIKETNLASAVREWVFSTTGHFFSTDLHQIPQLSTKRDMKTALQEIYRLEKQGIIEKASDRRGHFRTVDSQCEKIDFLSAGTEELELEWPLGIHEYYRTLRKNIIVIAGEQDAGKTAYLLNFAKLNMHKHRIRYYSSEMGDSEMRSRLEFFPDVTLEQWSALDARERSDNFSDVIHPDDVNIIDYMEMHDQFYLISAKLKQIHDKLRNGIAVVALQKSPGVELGRGGSFSLEKPRLYLTMRPDYPGGLIKIIKCKNWRNPGISPNGLEKHFKLYSGCQFSESTKWQRE